MSEKVKPVHLYHYTTAGGLLGIIRKQELWATDIRYLNDSTEFYLGRDAFKRVVKDKLQPMDKDTLEKRTLLALDGLLDLPKETLKQFPIYVCSFSLLRNDLSQWRAYCHDGGYSIGFPTDRLRALGERHDFVLTECKYGLKEAGYAIDAAFDGLKSCIPQSEEEATSMWLSHALVLGCFAATFKHEAFDCEKEWRLVCFTNRRPRQFKKHGDCLVPYVPFKLDDAALWEGAHIVVGPCSRENEELRLESVKALLESELQRHSLPTTCTSNVQLSGIPYRTGIWS